MSKKFSSQSQNRCAFVQLIPAFMGVVRNNAPKPQIGALFVVPVLFLNSGPVRHRRLCTCLWFTACAVEKSVCNLHREKHSQPSTDLQKKNAILVRKDLQLCLFPKPPPPIFWLVFLWFLLGQFSFHRSSGWLARSPRRFFGQSCRMANV